MTKDYLIKLLNDKHKNNISFQSSEKTNYEIYFKSIKDVVPVFDELHEYYRLGLVHSLCVHAVNDELKLMFFVNLGYEDVQSK